MTAPQSTPLPTAPARNQAEGTFVTTANAFVAALEPFRVELQGQADFVNTSSDSVDTALASTLAAQATTETARDVAVNAKDVAVNAKDVAVNAKDDAVNAKDDAQTAAVAAQTAASTLAYTLLGDYASAIEITSYDQIVRESGEFWRVSASVSLPYTTTGVWATDDEDFVSVGDATLRTDLVATDGAELVGYGAFNVSERLDRTTLNYVLLSSVVADTNLAIPSTGDLYVRVLERGNALFKVETGLTANGHNIVACTGVPSLQLNLVIAGEMYFDAFGMNADGTTEDTVGIQTAIDVMEAAGGGTLIATPGKDYHCKKITIDDDNITIIGRGARFVDVNPTAQADAVRITIASTADNIEINGLTLYTTHDTGQNWNLDIAGANVRLLGFNMHRADPEQEGNVGTYLRAADTVAFSNCNFTQGNFIFTSAQNVNIDNSFFRGGGDDGIAIKASTAGIITRNINISNTTFQGYTNMVALGTEVGDGALIETVNLSNCSGYDVGSVMWVKPGRGDIASYTNGTIRDVKATNCHTYIAHDSNVSRLSSLLWIDCDNGGKVFDVSMSHCSIRGRWDDAPTATTFGLFTAVTNGVISGTNLDDTDTIEGVTMTDCHMIDYYDGAVNSGSAPGYPIEGVIKLSNDATNGTIKDVKFVDCSANGSSLAGCAVFTNGNTGAEVGKVEFHRLKLRNISTDPASASQASGIRAEAGEVIIKGCDIEMDATGGSKPISSTTASDTADVYTGDSSYFSIGDISAGGSYDKSIFIAPHDCYVANIDLVASADITQDAKNYATFTTTNRNDATTPLHNAITTNAVDFDANTQTPLSSTPCVSSGAYMSKGDTLRLVIGSSASGQAISDLVAVIRYIEY